MVLYPSCSQAFDTHGMEYATRDPGSLQPHTVSSPQALVGSFDLKFFVVTFEFLFLLVDGFEEAYGT